MFSFSHVPPSIICPVNSPSAAASSKPSEPQPLASPWLNPRWWFFLPLPPGGSRLFTLTGCVMRLLLLGGGSCLCVCSWKKKCDCKRFRLIRPDKQVRADCQQACPCCLDSKWINTGEWDQRSCAARSRPNFRQTCSLPGSTNCAL